VVVLELSYQTGGVMKLENLTELELKALKALSSSTFGDTDFNFGSGYETAWFGSTDDTETRNIFKAEGIEGKSISGVMSSLVKKGFVIVKGGDDEFETYFYMPDTVYKQF
jgi:hypothetical protein